MDVRMQLLADARAADAERPAASRRIAALVGTCRRWILGVIPVDEPRREACPCP